MNRSLMPYGKGKHATIQEASDAATECLYCNAHFCAQAPLSRHMKEGPLAVADNQTGCPITEIREMNLFLSEGNFEKAFWKAMWKNPLFGVTGSACSAPCHSDCIAQEIQAVYSRVQREGEPVEIRKNELAVYEYGVQMGLTQQYVEQVKKAPKVNRKVRIVGGGPGAKAAAHIFLRGGWKVEMIFEGKDGLLNVIPNDHLPNEVVVECNRQLEELGAVSTHAVVVGNQAALGGVTPQVTIDQLASACDVILLVPGAGKAKQLEVSGQDLKGVIPAIPFLRGQKLEQMGLSNPFPKLKDTGEKSPRVLVVGAGDTSDDAVRSVRYLHGAEHRADLLVRSPIPKEVIKGWGIPNHPKNWIRDNEDIAEVRRGVVQELLGNSEGWVTHAILKDREGTITEIEVDNVVVAIGSEVNPDPWVEMGVEIKDGVIQIDENGWTMTSYKGKRIYAAGDATDREILPHAIESSIQTARAIMNFLGA